MNQRPQELQLDLRIPQELIGALADQVCQALELIMAPKGPR